MTKRILFWSIIAGKDLELDITNSVKDCKIFFNRQYALYDYDLVIMDLPNFIVYPDDYHKLHEYRDEVSRAMKSGKIIFCILDEPRTYYTRGKIYNNYSWTEVDYALHPNLTDSRGEVVLINKKSKFYNLFEQLFNSFKFVWNTDLRTNIAHSYFDFDVLAFNNGNLPVSFIFDYKADYGNGKIIFIPFISKEEAKKIKGFYISLIKIGLSLSKPSKTQEILLTPTPDWIKTYTIKNEEELKIKNKAIESKLTEIFEIKKLLYESGTALVSPVSIVFEKLGYKTENREKEGSEDIIVSSDNFKGLVEVKGLKMKGAIDKIKAGEFLGQLISHLKETYSQANMEDIKLILVINYDLDKEPTEKRKFGAIFTDRSIKILTSSGICILSTPQLFDIYNKVISNEGLKAKIRKKIENTNGLFSLE